MVSFTHPYWLCASVLTHVCLYMTCVRVQTKAIRTTIPLSSLVVVVGVVHDTGVACGGIPPACACLLLQANACFGATNFASFVCVFKTTEHWALGVHTVCLSFLSTHSFAFLCTHISLLNKLANILIFEQLCHLLLHPYCL